MNVNYRYNAHGRSSQTATGVYDYLEGSWDFWVSNLVYKYHKQLMVLHGCRIGVRGMWYCPEKFYRKGMSHDTKPAKLISDGAFQFGNGCGIGKSAKRRVLLKSNHLCISWFWSSVYTHALIIALLIMFRCSRRLMCKIPTMITVLSIASKL